MNTRSGSKTSMQVAKMGVIDCSNGNFQLPDGQVFNIKNEGSAPVLLEVSLAEMADGEFIETQFSLGWNPEIVKCVKQKSVQNLKWGF